MDGQIIRQYNDTTCITTFSESHIGLAGDFKEISFKLFYCYKGRIWLIHSNTNDYTFDIGFAKRVLEEWFETSDPNIPGLFYALKAHPELAYWFGQPIGGPDGLTLEQHTINVIDNYLKYFKDTQNIFSNEKEYFLCLALHDIGKPLALADVNKELQHTKTLEIIERLRNILPIDEKSIISIKNLINADPIGKYLNPAKNYTFEESSRDILDMSMKFEIGQADFVKTLVIYYQCDAAGYDSLRKRLFLSIEDDELVLVDDKSRLLFNDEYETKFNWLIDMVELL